MSGDNICEILTFIKANPSLSSIEIHDGLGALIELEYAAVKNIFKKLLLKNCVPLLALTYV